jgi:hypothetical protein
MDFFERLVKERTIHGVDMDTFVSYTIEVENPKLVIGHSEESLNEYGTKLIMYPVEVWDGDVLIGTFKYGRKTYKGNTTNVQAFVRAKETVNAS